MSICDAQAISGLSLVKTPTFFLGPIPDVINLAEVGKSLTIVATSTTPSIIGRVVFKFDGVNAKIERAFPYALSGDKNNQFFPFPKLATLGNHSVIVEAFHTNGTKLSRKSASFIVVDSTRAPTASPSKHATSYPSYLPTTYPSKLPTNQPSEIPLVDPSKVPSLSPWKTPVLLSSSPSDFPVSAPSRTPSAFPLTSPSMIPVKRPSENPIHKVKGELRKWHKVTIAFVGPFVSEIEPINPFLSYRLSVLFTHASSGKQYNVPGYFAADGNAAETSASSGDQWHCHLAPDEIGTWTFRANFVTGVNISTSNLPGTPTSFHGQTGSFTITGTNKSGRDHRGKGRLMYVGQHHLQFAETGEWFLKVGSDSPENFLAYNDFDNTPNNGNFRKSWAPHQKHYVAGSDPSWKNGKGSGIIGAINYLANQGVNAFSFLTMNINGDDKNVYPYVIPTDYLRMDVSKLAQWEIVLEHADTLGLFMHFKLAEKENVNLLNNGALGTERKLYYRELIARFGHHLALNWNLAEEITNTAGQIKSFSDYFKETDPYQHVVLIHTIPKSPVYDALYKSLTGHPTIDGISLQLSPVDVFPKTLQWVNESALSGRKWIVTNDEQNSARDGVVPDSVDPNHDLIRQRVLWGNIMAGGAGVEYYFGYGHNNSDLTCQDYSSRQNMWKQSRHALEFFQNNNIPISEMSYDRSNRVNGQTSWMLSNLGNSIFVIYRHSLSSTSTISMMNLIGAYSVGWYNPRDGGLLQGGSVATIMGGTSSVNLGSPPNPLDKKDWAILLRKV